MSDIYIKYFFDNKFFMWVRVALVETKGTTNRQDWQRDRNSKNYQTGKEK